MAFAYSPPSFPCNIIVIKTNGHKGKTFKFERKDWCLLGANSDCDIRVPFDDVAELNALVFVKQNGVYLQGIDKTRPVSHPRLEKSLLNEEEVPLTSGDVFLLGERAFLVEFDASQVEKSSASPRSGNFEVSQNTRSAKKLRSQVKAVGSEVKRRRGRKSSLVVGEFDETYVVPTEATDKLLSHSQRARLSGAVDSTAKQAKIRSGASATKAFQEEEIGNFRFRLDYSSDDESASPLRMEQNEANENHPEGVSETLPPSESDRVQRQEKLGKQTEHRPRTDTLNSVDEAHVHVDKKTVLSFSQPSTTQKESATSQANLSAGEAGKLSARQRKNLAFSRLSKGLPATPRRNKDFTSMTRTEIIVNTALLTSASESASNFFMNKENIPHSEAAGVLWKKADSIVTKSELKSQAERSPLSDKSLEPNSLLASPQSTRFQGKNKTPRGTKGLAPATAVQKQGRTPRGRSVAFARSIELEAGPHYSPLRLKTNRANHGKGSSRKHREAAGCEAGANVKSNKIPSPSPSRGNHSEADASRYIEGPPPSASLERLGTFYFPSEGTEALHLAPTEPTLEFDEDSEPPTPSTSDEEGRGELRHTAAVSPMARVGGAVAAFLKRLSGTLESDSASSDSEEGGDTETSNTMRISESVSREQSSRIEECDRRSEPIMSGTELDDLSSKMSPSKRADVLEKVRDAASVVRQLSSASSDQEKDDAMNQSSDRPICQDDAAQSASVFGHRAPNERVEMTCAGEERRGSESKEKVRRPNSYEFRSGGISSHDLPSEQEHVGDNGIHQALEDGHAQEETVTSLFDSSNDFEELGIDEACTKAKQEIETSPASEDSEGEEIDYADKENSQSAESAGGDIAAVVLEREPDTVKTICPAKHCSDGHDEGRADVQSKDADLRGNVGAIIEGEMDAVVGDLNLRSTDCDTDTPRVEVSVAQSSRQVESVAGQAPHVEALTSTDSFATSEDMSLGKGTQIPDNSSVDAADLGKEDNERNSRRSPCEQEQVAEDEMKKELTRLKVVELRRRLHDQKLNANGLKKELVERLALHLAAMQKKESRERAENEIASKVLPEKTLGDEESGANGSDQRNHEERPTASSASTRRSARKNSRKGMPNARQKGKNTGSEVGAASVAGFSESESKSPPEMRAEPTSETEEPAITGEQLENDIDFTSYRRRTVKELRQFLKNRNLDIQAKLRKEELIQHLVSLSIGSSGEDLEVPAAKAEPDEECRQTVSGTTRENIAVSRGEKLAKLTVGQLRARLKDAGLCQAGTKKILLERLSSQPAERKTRRRRVMEASASDAM